MLSRWTASPSQPIPSPIYAQTKPSLAHTQPKHRTFPAHHMLSPRAFHPMSSPAQPGSAHGQTRQHQPMTRTDLPMAIPAHSHARPELDQPRLSSAQPSTDHGQPSSCRAQSMVIPAHSQPMARPDNTSQWSSQPIVMPRQSLTSPDHGLDRPAHAQPSPVSGQPCTCKAQRMRSP